MTEDRSGMLSAMVINKYSTIKEIQNGFNIEFPFLRLEFISDDQQVNGKKINSSLSLSSISNFHNGIHLEFGSNTTISELKNNFKEAGLTIKIFRKAGRVWVETSHTDNWSLGRQNEEGELFSAEFGS